MNKSQIKLFLRNKTVEIINGLFEVGKPVMVIALLLSIMMVTFFIIGQLHFIIPDSWLLKIANEKLMVDLYQGSIGQYVVGSMGLGVLLFLVLVLLSLVLAVIVAVKETFKPWINENVKLAKAGTKVDFKWKK